MDKGMWRTMQQYCPNCSKILTGVLNDRGVCKMTCDRCRAAIVSSAKSVRHYVIDIKMPTTI